MNWQWTEWDTRNAARLIAGHGIPIRMRRGILYALDMRRTGPRWIVAPLQRRELLAWLGY